MRDSVVYIIGVGKRLVSDLTDQELSDFLVDGPYRSGWEVPKFQPILERMRLEQYIRSLGLSS